jgi:UDP:flavonoid glycosyltransferase YjiC (YdhE family)
MRILFSSVIYPGHLNPLLPYAQVLRDRGHEVRIAAPKAVAEKLQKAGLAHVAYEDTSYEEIVVAFEGEEGMSEEERQDLSTPRFFVGLLARRALPVLRETIKIWKPDLIVRESCEYAAHVAADEAKVPHVRVAVLNPDNERKCFKLNTSAIDDLRETTGLAPDGGASLCTEPVFTAFPTALGETRIANDAPAPFVVQMPSVEVRTDAPTPAWAPRNGETFLYMTFGTVSGTTDRERAVYRTALDAVADLPVQVLLTTGPNMAEHPLGDIPPNVIVETFVPQAEVLPHAQAVVTHGGSGTMLGALAAGVPLVIAPMFADQPDNARAVEAAGAGVAVFDADSASLRAGIESVLKDPDFLVGAKKVSTQMAEMPGIDEAVDVMLATACAPAVDL